MRVVPIVVRSGVEQGCQSGLKWLVADSCSLKSAAVMDAWALIIPWSRGRLPPPPYVGRRGANSCRLQRCRTHAAYNVEE